MRILAIDTSHPAGSIALAEQGSPDPLLAVRTLPDGFRTAQSLLPEIERLLAERRCHLAEIQCLAVAVGPGSFTGLRIGVTAAKTLAYANGSALVGVDTLDAWAYGRAYPTRLWAVFDAGRGQQVAACYEQGDPTKAAARRPESVAGAQLMATEIWLEQLKQQDVCCGPLVSRLRPALPEGVTILSPDQPLAANVARLALLLYEHGQTSDPMTLTPNYYRASAAEEKAAGRSS